MIREMLCSDSDQVLSILNESILSGTSTGRYDCPTQGEWERSISPYCRYVWEENGEVLGFIVLHPFSPRPCYHGVGEISVYVAEKARRKGIGKQLLQKVVDESERYGYWTLTSNIFATNEASCKLHEALGFRRVGYREHVLKTKSGEWMSTVIYELHRDLR